MPPSDDPAGLTEEENQALWVARVTALAHPTLLNEEHKPALLRKLTVRTKKYAILTKIIRHAQPEEKYVRVVQIRDYAGVYPEKEVSRSIAWKLGIIPDMEQIFYSNAFYRPIVIVHQRVLMVGETVRYRVDTGMRGRITDLEAGGAEVTFRVVNSLDEEVQTARAEDLVPSPLDSSVWGRLGDGFPVLGV